MLDDATRRGRVLTQKGPCSDLRSTSRKKHRHNADYQAAIERRRHLPGGRRDRQAVRDDQDHARGNVGVMSIEITYMSTYAIGIVWLAPNKYHLQMVLI